MQPIQRRAIYVLIIVAGLVWIALNADKTEQATAGQIPAPQKGFLAPDFALKTSAGGSVTLSDLRGQAVLINLWASWCPPCRAEMPTIQKLYEEYKDQGFIVLAVNATNQDNSLAMMDFVKANKLTFPILLDEVGDVSSKYQLHSLPSSFFIDRNGIIQEVVVGGPMAEALLRTRIESILK